MATSSERGEPEQSPADWLLDHFDSGRAWREHEARVADERSQYYATLYGPDWEEQWMHS